MEELGFTEEELRPICPVTGNSDLEELGQMTENELRHFSYSDIEGIKKYMEDRKIRRPVCKNQWQFLKKYIVYYIPCRT